MKFSMKAIRVNLGLSRDEMAEKLGVCKQTVANWETGKTEPTLAILRKFSNLFNISIDDIKI